MNNTFKVCILYSTLNVFRVMEKKVKTIKYLNYSNNNKIIKYKFYRFICNSKSQFLIIYI